MKKELIFLSWRVLCYPGCAVPKELGYYLQAYSSVQAPDSIGVSDDVGEERLDVPTKNRRLQSAGAKAQRCTEAIGD